MEELNNQLAEAQGFSGAKEVLSLAYQESKGGNLTGQKAEAELLAQMKKGNVIAEKVLPIFSRMLGEQAAGGREAYLNTTGAQHNRFKNALSSSIETFGMGGFDKGMTNFFKFMADFLTKHSEDIRNLGKAFLDLEKAFERIVQGAAPLAALLLPLFALLGTGVGKIALLISVLDDLSVFVRGGDSVLGDLVNFLTELTGLNYNAIAVGLGVIGVAVTAAFSPMIAAIAAVGALIEAYKYVQGLKNQTAPTAPQVGAPSIDDINKFSSINLAKATETNTGAFGKGYAWLRSATNAAGNATGLSFDNIRGYQYADRSTVQKLQAALRDGTITEDEQDRYFRAMGTGMMSGDQVLSNLSMLGSKRNNPNIFPSQQIPPIELYLNGTFDNQKVNVLDIISQFSSKDSQPKDQIGATP